jgi:PAS domain S-box-containing protein
MPDAARYREFLKARARRRPRATESNPNKDDAAAINECLRDVVALSTLPVIWSGADPFRIAESLAASLFTTLNPEFVYVFFPSGSDRTPIAVAQTDRYRTSPDVAKNVGDAILDWARTRDSDDVLLLPNPLGTGALRVAARPLGTEAELGVIAAAFADANAPTPVHHLVLNVAATQVATAVRNAQLLQSLRESEEQARHVVDLQNANVEIKNARRAALEGRQEAVRSRQVAETLNEQLRNEIAERQQAEAALRGSNERVTNIVESITDAFTILDKEWRITYLNGRAEEYLRSLGKTREELLGKQIWEEFPDLVGSEMERNYRKAIAEQTTVEFEWYYPPFGGWFEVRAYPSKEGLSIFSQEVTARKKAEAALAAEKEVLEQIATGAELAQVLDTLMREAEAQSLDGMLCSVLLLDESGRRLFQGGAPSLPAAYNQAIDGLCIGPHAGSCGTAAYERRAVFVTDIATDPLWADFKELASAHGLGACCSLPIFSSRGQLLGTVAMYYPRPHRPSAHDRQIVFQAVQMAAIAIERKRAEEALKRQAEELERTNRMKDEFLATLSHELRTPLNAILGWSSLLRGGGWDAATVASALETIERNAKSQNRLIEDILDVSRIITGKLRLEVKPVAFISIIQATADAVRPAVEAKGIKLILDFDPAADRLLGDPNRLQQVVWNFLSNAIKFTPSGGRIEVSLKRAGPQIELQVRDDGEGIDPDFLPFVFDRFRQADSSSTRFHAGLGLGLSIVRHLVELHGGSVRAESPGKGQGARFLMTLPIPAVYLQEEGVQSDLRPQGTASMKSFPALDNVSVLVVDDEADARQLIQSVLERCRAAVTAVGSTGEAIEAFAKSRPDVLVSDIGMPGEDGYALIRRVRALEAGKVGVPAVALTAYARQEDRLEALSAGYQVHLPKPIEPEQLARVIAHLIGRAA